MPEPLPNAVLLDIRPEYATFTKQVAPYLEGLVTTPEHIVEELWEAMFDKDVWDERVLDTVGDINARLQTQRATLGDTFENLVHDFAKVIYDRVEHHNLHGLRGYLPFNMRVVHNGLLVLKVDHHLDQVQQELDTGEEAEDDLLEEIANS